MFSSASDLWETPQEFFNALDAEFHFNLDVCALPENAKCAAYYTPEMDGLSRPWHGRCWCNPPYGREIGKWVQKAAGSAENGALVVMLLPARTDTQWFHEHILNPKREIRFVRGRLKFGGAKNSAPFPSMVVVFRPREGSVWRNRGLVAEAAADVIETGVLAGQSVRRMSREMMEQTCTHSVSNAARLIRTEVNYFCNQGALEGYREAEIEEYEFLATLDLRTSAACRELDGKKFPLAKAQPGKNCPPVHPYCRSTVVPIIDTPGLKRMEKRAARDTETGKSVQIGDMSYEEWKEWQKSGNPDIWDTLIRKGKNRSADRQQYQEYRKILGGKIPSRFDDFQNLKYNEPEKWEKLKKQKRQLVFLENADCVTTPKKFTGYFLKPGAKHADEFFDVGYTPDDPVQLRYDMAKQFDVGKAVEFSKNPNGQEKFSIFMDLGVTKSRTFRTVWQKDTPDSAPRIITAHREGTKND